jgi:hypothetical protein
MRYQKVQGKLDVKHLNTLQACAPLNLNQFSPSAAGRPIWCHVVPHTQTLSISLGPDLLQSPRRLSVA